jgi:hypothetical protein
MSSNYIFHFAYPQNSKISYKQPIYNINTTKNILISETKKKYFVLPYKIKNNLSITLTNDTSDYITLYSNNDVLMYNSFLAPTGVDSIKLQPYSYTNCVFTQSANSTHWNISMT